MDYNAAKAIKGQGQNEAKKDLEDWEVEEKTYCSIKKRTICYNFKLLSDSSLYSCLVLGKLSIVYSHCTWF